MSSEGRTGTGALGVICCGRISYLGVVLKIRGAVTAGVGWTVAAEEFWIVTGAWGDDDAASFAGTEAAAQIH